MAEQQKEKSPEELGEAVGQKIEALFGGFFAEDAAPVLEEEPAPKKEAAVQQRSSVAPLTIEDETATVEIPPPFFAPKTPAKPSTPATPVSSPSEPVGDGQAFDALAELIEALILNLEWEITPEVIEEVANRFKELERYFPSDSQARSVLSMNYRVLQRFKDPEAGSHPLLVKMLQDGLTCLKLLRSSPGNRQTTDSLFADITDMYKQIAAVTEPTLKPVPAQPKIEEPAPQPPPQRKPPAALKPVPTTPDKPVGVSSAQLPAYTAAPAEQGDLGDRIGTAIKSLEDVGQYLTKIVGVLKQGGEISSDGLSGIDIGSGSVKDYRTLMSNSSAAVQSLEDVAQRFSRILGVLRQKGEMSTEDITRRLSTVEHLLSDRVGKLGRFFRDLAAIPIQTGSSSGSAKAGGGSSPDGLLTILWGGSPLAIPSSIVTSIFPITKKQGDQIKDKPSLVLEGRNVQRLPLKKPPAQAQQDTRGTLWLVHITVGDKDYFLLADRSLGYRRAPEGTDVTRQQRINLAGTAYVVLNQASFQ